VRLGVAICVRVCFFVVLTGAHRNLSNSDLIGSIPTAIAQLVALSRLYVTFLGGFVCLTKLTPDPTSLLRNLYSNQLTGQIPTRIGELRALTRLYVSCVLIVPVAHDVAQISWQQQIDRTDSRVDCTIDGTQLLV
jgi:hypothetical protein